MTSWISVEDRLPEDEQEVLYYRCAYFAYGFYKASGSWIDLTMRDRDGEPHEYYSGVTHWLPLPAPPEATDGN